SATCTTTGAPLLAYAPERDAQKPRTLANPADAETFLLAATYAAQGYVVVATDYLGYAKSSFPYHPYLHADSEASSVIDSLRAARSAASEVGASLSGKVMFAGYSDGGHSSMAAHRAAERENAAEFNVVAGAHLAGPYNLSGLLRSPVVIVGYQFFVPFAVNAWQSIYGNVYNDINTVYRMPYASYIATLLPSPTLTFTTLLTTGPTPSIFWLPGAAGETPTQARDLVFQAAFITDVQTNNSDGFYLDAKLNDELGWNPKAKTLLCGGAGDPTVSPALHRDVAYADFQSRGLTNVTKVDVDPMIQATYGPGGVAPAPGSAQFATYYGSYHSSYEPPFCHAAAKALFDSVK
ncbi:MAG: lipase family protein, partial [Pseudomonadota bacterium]|nr:lipase family protein [Pseudomonadota bacterium]